MHFENLELREEDGLATITLNRPEAANAIDMEMARELMRAAIHCDQSADVRVVLLDAKGKRFCAGGDLKSFVDAGEALPALLKELTTNLHGAISRLSRMQAPLVVAVQGPAAGAGVGVRGGPAAWEGPPGRGDAAQFEADPAGLVPDGVGNGLSACGAP